MFFIMTCSAFFFFFFKQKTAYEMRISDWSSDVCSSDLLAQLHLIQRHRAAMRHREQLRTGQRAAVEGDRLRAHTPANARACANSTFSVAANSSRLTSNCCARRKSFTVKIGRASCRERVCKYV